MDLWLIKLKYAAINLNIKFYNIYIYCFGCRSTVYHRFLLFPITEETKYYHHTMQIVAINLIVKNTNIYEKSSNIQRYVLLIDRDK